MNYEQALEKLRRLQFGIVVQYGKDPNTGEFVYYVLKFKGDHEIEKITENHVDGVIVAVKSGSELYTVGGHDQ